MKKFEFGLKNGFIVVKNGKDRPKDLYKNLFASNYYKR